MTQTRPSNRGQSPIRALFVLLAIFSILLITVAVVLMPLLSGILPVISSSTAAQNADFVNINVFLDQLRIIAYVGFPVTIMGLMIAWVLAWYIRKQSSVRR